MSDRATGLPAYAELHCLSCFSFQRGASRPGELVERAWKLGYAGIAITDECSVSGVVRAHGAWKDLQPQAKDFQLILGSEFRFDGFRLVALARNVTGWGNLCEFITAARCDAPKGEYRVSRERGNFDLLAECEILVAPEQRPGNGEAQEIVRIAGIAQWARSRFGASASLAVELLQGLDDALWLHILQQAGRAAGVPLLACGDVHMHVRSRKALQDVMTAVREGKAVSDCGLALQPSAERVLRSRMKLASLYPPELLDNTLVVARRCTFSLESIKYQYPMETVPPGMTPAQALRAFTMEGAAKRYPAGVPSKVLQQIEHELRLIAECQYEMYFLTVHDIVRHAREQRILCQGRGSAANSAVCYCLHITEVDPARANLLFERFISKARNEPPDIDVDFEHQRREEVIQYIYKKYGRDRSAIAAVVATYRTRSAIRDVGKALGIPEPLVDAFAKEHFWFDEQELQAQRLCERAAEAGIEMDSLRMRQWLELTEQLRGLPRHLSQHVGGFVLTQGKLTRLVPVENAAMPDRSIIQWDKDDLDDMGLLKVDVLALGMLSALRRCLDLVSLRRGVPFALQDIADRDEATYDMICRADTVGVFQIESRAQMSMLPRLQPREFYDLVIEVAIVRPGPIQGGMIHPYLKNRDRVRRGGTIEYANGALKPALERTLGVPIFQEQVMQIAMIAAGFSAEEADRLRRSMAAWKRRGGVHQFHDRLIDGMVKNGYGEQFARGIFEQILGFGEYGFPESHAASFALLAYDSSWLKCHEPECFLAAMLNSQPMGFYSPSQLVQDARRHRVRVFPPDVGASDWDCTLEWLPGEGAAGERPGVRLGLRMVAGLTEAGAQRLVQARAQAPFASTEDMALRSRLDVKDVNALAAGDALQSLSGHRRQQVWDARAFVRPTALLESAPLNEETLALPAASEGEEIVFDYASLGLTLRRHPLALLRPRLERMKLQTSAQLHDLPHGRKVRACGIVTVRQQPQTANGTIFITLEDETGPVNVIVWKSLREQQRGEVLLARLLAVEGIWQRDVESGGNVRNLVAHRLKDLTPLLGRLGRQPSSSRDFH